MIFLFRVEVLKEQNLKHNKIYIDVLKKTNTNDKNIQDYIIYIYIIYYSAVKLLNSK